MPALAMGRVAVLVPTSTLGSHVGLIVGNAAKGQVLGIDAHADIADVHDDKSVRDLPVRSDVGCSVGVHAHAVDRHSTVPDAVRTSSSQYAGTHGLTAYPMKDGKWVSS